MKVAILTPSYLHSTVGNAVTVRRIESQLRKYGCVTEIFTLETYSPAELMAAVRSFSPDVIHAFNAIRCGAIAAEIMKTLNIPYIITFTGTDIYQVGDRNFSDEERLQIETASALVAFHEIVAARVRAVFPEMGSRIKTVTQGVEIPSHVTADYLAESPFVFFLPAGIRPVKNVLSGIRSLEKLWCRYPQIKLLLAGPVLDDCYAKAVMEALDASSFASWLGEVPNFAMPALYRSAHVVLNTSFSEGGMANSILEAMAYNRPVLVSAVEGNCSLVSDGDNGFLYSSEDEFLAKAERLLLDKELRKRVAAGGRAYVLENCQTGKEAKSYLEIYMNILATRKGV